MKTITLVRSAFALVLALAGPVGATVLFAGPLPPGDGDSLSCSIVNVSTHSHEVLIEFFGFDGSKIGGLVAPDNIGSLEVKSIGIGGGIFPNIPVTCKFTADGASNDYRANACLISESGTRVCVPAE